MAEQEHEHEELEVSALGEERERPVIEELDEETRARRDAALSHVRKLGDPVLRASAVPVDRFDARLAEEIENMGELMDAALGIGLAATQVGILHRVLVYRAHSEDPITALVNPVIEWRSDELEVAEEGCLSLPGIHVDVERPARVRARARDAQGEEIVVDAEGLQARVIQHEVDHLDGILILDRISREDRRQAMRELRRAREGRTEDGDDDDAHEGDGGHGAADRAGADEGHGARAGEPEGAAADEPADASVRASDAARA